MADVTDAAALRRAADAVMAELGPPDVWINCAGNGVYGRFATVPEAEFDHVTAVTYGGTVNGCRVALALMRPRGTGTIVNVCSATAFHGLPLMTSYAGAKAAVRGFGQALQAELTMERSRIRLSTVFPPAVNTPFFSHAVSHMGAPARPAPPVYQPEVIGAGIYFAATTGRAEVAVSGTAVAFSLITRISPRFTAYLMSRIGFDGQLSRDPDAVRLQTADLVRAGGGRAAGARAVQPPGPPVQPATRTEPRAARRTRAGCRGKRRGLARYPPASVSVAVQTRSVSAVSRVSRFGPHRPPPLHVEPGERGELRRQADVQRRVRPLLRIALEGRQGPPRQPHRPRRTHQLRGDHARMHDVAHHAGALQPRRPGEAGHHLCQLGLAVGLHHAPVPPALQVGRVDPRAVGRGGADVDDAGAAMRLGRRAQAGHQGARHHEGRQVVGGEHPLVPFRRFFAMRAERAHVVHQQVDLREAGVDQHAGLPGGGNQGKVGDQELQPGGGNPLRDPLHGGVARLAVAPHENDDLASARQPQRDPAADPAAGTRDDADRHVRKRSRLKDSSIVACNAPSREA